MKVFFEKILNKFYINPVVNTENYVIDNLDDSSLVSNVDVILGDNYIKIDIKSDCHLEECINEIDNLIGKEITDKIANIIIMDGIPNVKKKTIYIIEKDNYLYNIAFKEDEINISQKKKEETEIRERIITINKKTRAYEISLMFHTFGLSTKSTKFYNTNKSLDNEVYKYFLLDKGEALFETRELLESLKHINNINDIISISSLYNYLNLIKEESYFPIISNKVLSLSCGRSDNSDISDVGYKTFDIILNSTLENIGTISFNYLCKSGFTYSGNVGYDIKEQFRNNGYATIALGLLKSLLKLNGYSKDKDLYISTLPNNIASQRVAIKNKGRLCYEGDVPKEDSIYYIDGVRSVKVYRIKV